MKTAVLSLILSWSLCGQSYTVSTVAGGPPANIAGPSASIGGVSSVAADPAGNLYFLSGNSVLRIDAVTRILTLVAGNGTPGFSGDHGPAISAQLNAPNAIAVDLAGNIYIADSNRIRKISSGIITTIAGNGTAGVSGDNGLAVNAEVAPLGLAADAAGNLFFSDTLTSTLISDTPPGPVFVASGSIRKISNGLVATIAGNGTCCGPSVDNVPAASVPLYEPSGIAVDSAGNLYVACNGDVDFTGKLRKIANGTITTVAGGGTVPGLGDGGPATGASLPYLWAVAVDSAGNLYIVDPANVLVRKISGGVITTLAGDGARGYGGDNGPAGSAQFNSPAGLAVDSAGNVYIADQGNYRIREVSQGIVTTVAGNGYQSFSGDNGPAASAQFWNPAGIAADSAGNLYIADSGNNRIREISHGIIASVVGDGAAGFGGDNGPATAAHLNDPGSIAVDSAGNLYIADTGNNRVRKVSQGVITTVAGRGSPTSSNGDGGPATSASLFARDVAVDSAGNLYISDSTDDRIREVSQGIIDTVAGDGTSNYGGDGGPGISAQLSNPLGVAVDAAGNLYIADAGNNRIRKLSNGIITTMAGTGTLGFSGDNGPATGAELYAPQGIALDAAGNLYITNGGLIREVANGIVTRIAGSGTAGYGGENVPALSAGITPVGLAVDPAGNIYFSEPYANRIRVLKPCGTACAVPPTPVVTAVVNAASFSAGIEAGSWVTIVGAGLANTNPGRVWDSEDFVNSTLLPTQLDGVGVTIDGNPAFVEYISPTQINVQAPFDIAVGSVNVVVTNNGAASAPFQAQLQTVAPAFFLYPGTNYAVASRLPDYAAVGNQAVPAKPGDTLVLWGTGFGATSPAVAAGTVVTGTPAAAAPTLTIGGVTVPVISTILTAGSAGLYQITVQLPATAPSGSVAVQASVGGLSTPAGVTIIVGNP